MAKAKSAKGKKKSPKKLGPAIKSSPKKKQIPKPGKAGKKPAATASSDTHQPKRSTFDILDAGLPVPGDMSSYEAYEKLPDEVRLKTYERTYLTDPILWKRHCPPKWVINAKWKHIKYDELDTPADLKQHIKSTSPGIYLFYVKPESMITFHPSYALYVGISNEHDSKRALRERLEDYLPGRILGKTKRLNIAQMIAQFYPALWIAYILTTRSSKVVMEVEEKLHGYLSPPHGIRDFPQDIKDHKKRFGI